MRTAACVPTPRARCLTRERACTCAGHVAQHPEREWVVSMSFIQIYLETIQVTPRLALCLTSVVASAWLPRGTHAVAYA